MGKDGGSFNYCILRYVLKYFLLYFDNTNLNNKNNLNHGQLNDSYAGRREKMDIQHSGEFGGKQ
ncbi:MAG: hypothetical protein ACYCR2_03865 [Thermoplasmataceae archaeon]